MWSFSTTQQRHRAESSTNAWIRVQARCEGCAAYRAHDAAQQAQSRLARIGKHEGSGDKLTVHGNLLSVASSQTEAQTRIIEDCLDRSSG